MKHRLKLWLREAYARLLHHTGLHAVVDRMMPPRLTILCGHCVAPSDGNAFLPKDMKIDAGKLERIVRSLQRRYRVCSVREGLDRLRSGERRSSVALSMDDGYRDNHSVMLPLLANLGASATVYLVTELLDGRRVDWTHKHAWILSRIGAEEFVRRYGDATADAANFARIEAAIAAASNGQPASDRDIAYHFKRNLKYEAEVEDRDATLDRVFRDLGGDEPALARALLMDWDAVRELQAAGCELGCHTLEHPVLSRLDRDEARRQIVAARTRIEDELGAGTVTTFAYPFGRRWDYTKETRELIREAGFDAAVNTHSGIVSPSSEPTELARIMIDEDAKLHLITAEACGGFELLRRFGVNLSE